jgi:hypothetical protein
VVNDNLIEELKGSPLKGFFQAANTIPDHECDFFRAVFSRTITASLPVPQVLSGSAAGLRGTSHPSGSRRSSLL